MAVPIFVGYEQINGEARMSEHPALKLTDAERAAGVTPVNYAFQPGDSRRYASLYDWASVGGVLLLDGSSYNITAATNASALTFPDGTHIIGAPGSEIVATGSNDYHALRALGSLIIEGVTLTRADTAQNTSYKAIHADNSLAALPSGTRIVVQNCAITGFDIGVYVDGGAAQNVLYAEISGCHIVINNLGTSGGASVRPTVGCNNCYHVAIQDNPLLEASDLTNAVNNIYCIGSRKLEISNNNIANGVSIKVLSNSSNVVEDCTIADNRLITTQYVYFQADTQPIRRVRFGGNNVIGPNTNIATPAVLVFETNASHAITGDAFECVQITENYFKDCPHSVLFVNMSSGHTFGLLTCEGNEYLNVSTSGAGTYGIVSNGGAGTYRSFNANNETVIGNSNTRAYIQAALTFGTTNFGDIIESGCTNARSGVNQGSYTGTLVNGVSGAVTGTIQWTERDGLVTLYIPTINDTSTTVAQKQITGTVPTIIKPTTQQRCIGLCLDNSTGKISIIQIETTGTITLYNALASAFTAAGTCGTSACTVTFRTTT